MTSRGPGSPNHPGVVAVVVSVIGAVASEPTLWSTAVRQARMLVPPRWWTRRPFLPVPDRDYLRFRMVTAYGGDGSMEPDPSDVIAYLRWCRTVETLA